MRRREFTPNDTRGVIRILSLRYAGTARGRNRILLVTVILCITALTMVGKKKFNFYYEGRTLQVKGSPRFCANKYVHLFDGLRAAREREKEEV